MKKRLMSLFTSLFMLLGIFLAIPLDIDAKAASYSQDYRYWSQGGSDDQGMREVGCWIVAQAKMLYEANINRDSSFNPDVYFQWQVNNGYVKDVEHGDYNQTNGGYAPVAYANQCGKNLEYLGYWNASDDQLWYNINAGYYTILYVGGTNTGGSHYVLIDNDLSKSSGKLYCYDSFSDRGSIVPQLITRYSIHKGGYVYKANNPISTFWYSSMTPVDIGDEVYGSLIKNDGWVNIGNVDGDVKLNDSIENGRDVWRFVRQNDGSYIIYSCVNTEPLLCLDGYDGLNVNLWEYYGGTCQRWYIYGPWNGEYIFRHQGSDKVLTVPNNSNEIGTDIILDDYDNSASQKMSIYGMDKAGSSILSVSVGTSETLTKFSWGVAPYATHYSIRIKSGISENLFEYKNIWNYTDTSYSIVLPEGHYEVYVDCCNRFSFQSTNVVSFNITRNKNLIGDINSDGRLNISDAVLLQKYLLNVQEFSEDQWKTADINEDGYVDSFDMVLLRKKLINQ